MTFWSYRKCVLTQDHNSASLNKQRNDRRSAHPSTDGAAVIPRIFSECDLGPAEACQSVREISGFHGDFDKMSRHLRAQHFDGHAVGDPPLDFRPSIAGNTASCSNRTRLETLKYAGTAARPPPRARCLFPDLYRRFPDADELAMLRAWATANPRAACSAPCGAGRSRSRAPRTAMILLSCSIIPRRNANGTRRLSPRPSMPCAPRAPPSRRSPTSSRSGSRRARYGCCTRSYRPAKVL